MFNKWVDRIDELLGSLADSLLKGQQDNWARFFALSVDVNTLTT